MSHPDRSKIPCTSLAVLSHFQRDAVQVDIGALPTPAQWTAENELQFEEKVLSAMSKASAPLLERHQAPTARLAILLRAMGRLDARTLRQRSVALDSEMGRWIAKLINEVAQTQPELLTRRGTWLLGEQSPEPTLAALLHCHLYADVHALSQESCSLLATCLTDDLIREQCYFLTQDGQVTHLLWAASVAGKAGRPVVLDSMHAPGRLERLYELAAQDGLQGAHSRALLSRLAKRSAEAGAPGWTRWDSLTPASANELRSHPFKVLANAMVGRTVRGKPVTLNGIDDTLSTLSAMVRVSSEDGALRFGRAFNAALEQSALETTLWRNATQQLVGRAAGGMGRLDLVQEVFDVMRRAGQLTPEFVSDFRQAFWARRPYDFVAAAVNARVVEVEMNHRIGAQTQAAPSARPRSRASV
jgi:hypothetical protein